MPEVICQVQPRTDQLIYFLSRTVSEFGH